MGRSMRDPKGLKIVAAASPASTYAEQAEVAVAVFRSAVGAALGMGNERWPGCGPHCVLGCGGAGQSQMFRAVPCQVRVVRDFVRLALAGHPATDDAVVVASELAANSVAHSGSGRAGGMFTVHVVPLGADAVGLAVTELRGNDFPEVREAIPDSVSGRGLAVVQALTSLFWMLDAGEIRILLATVPAPPGGGEPSGGADENACVTMQRRQSRSRT